MFRLRKDTQKGRVFVGLSGGVDSSVAAALLLEGGYDVTGVFIKGWHPPFLSCTWQEDRRDAMRVAAHLGIPFTTLDLSQEYKRDVADYLIREYKAGRTPNPDAMCNRAIKFGAFFDWALEQGADFVATGHYARVKKNKRSNRQRERWDMRTARDDVKDQTYFLWAIPHEKLAHLLFPVGDYKKSEVRKLAERFGLPTFNKKDSQGVCFLGKLDMKEFLSAHIRTEPGPVLDLAGNVVGEHGGAALYTLGQRHGFTTRKRGVRETPYYVVDKNIMANTVTVAHAPDAPQQGRDRTVRISDCNWLGEVPVSGSRCKGRYRHRQPYVPVKLSLVESKTATVELTQGMTAPAAGQSLVLYERGRCIGGGIVT